MVASGPQGQRWCPSLGLPKGQEEAFRELSEGEETLRWNQ